MSKEEEPSGIAVNNIVHRGDAILVEAKVIASRSHQGQLFVQFKNGDSLPLGSVIVNSIQSYELKKGEEVYHISRPERLGEVVTVYGDQPTPQVAWRPKVSSKIEIADLVDMIPFRKSVL